MQLKETSFLFITVFLRSDLSPTALVALSLDGIIHIE